MTNVITVSAPVVTIDKRNYRQVSERLVELSQDIQQRERQRTHPGVEKRGADYHWCECSECVWLRWLYSEQRDLSSRQNANYWRGHN